MQFVHSISLRRLFLWCLYLGWIQLTQSTISAYTQTQKEVVLSYDGSRQRKNTHHPAKAIHYAGHHEGSWHHEISFLSQRIVQVHVSKPRTIGMPPKVPLLCVWMPPGRLANPPRCKESSDMHELFPFDFLARRQYYCLINGFLVDAREWYTVLMSRFAEKLGASSHLRVNFWPAMTGAAVVDFELALPHIGHAFALYAHFWQYVLPCSTFVWHVEQELEYAA